MGSVAALSIALCACSGQSNSVLPGETSPPTNSAGTGGAPGTGGTSPVASAGASNTPAPAGGSGGSVIEQPGIGASLGGGAQVTAGTGGGVASGGQPATGCGVRSSVTLGVRMTVPVTWPATLGTTGGSGDFELTNIYRLTVDGTSMTGTVSPCGSALPPFTFSGLIGGGNCRIEIPDGVWDTAGFPAFDSTATIAGWEPGSALTVPSDGVALVGLTMADPTAAWPDSYTGVDAPDTDADGNPGITAIPATGQGFASPPVSIIGPRVDQVYLATRTGVELNGAFTSCTEIEGDVTLTLFDQHVVGCRTVDGDTCNANQTDFVDVNRTIYTAMPGTFKASILSEGATCSDARAIP
jgi:hypothetical protein